MITASVAVAAPASISAGAASDVTPMGQKCLYLLGVGVGTYQAQISPDGTNWINEGTALTASGNVFIEKPCMKVRWNCTAYTNGTPTSVVMGTTASSANW